jgi:hypothetical protein
MGSSAVVIALITATIKEALAAVEVALFTRRT